MEFLIFIANYPLFAILGLVGASLIGLAVILGNSPIPARMVARVQKKRPSRYND